MIIVDFYLLLNSFTINHLFGKHTILSYAFKYHKYNLAIYLLNKYKHNVNIGGG